MKIELTDNELQMYYAKVKVWQNNLDGYIRDNFMPQFRATLTHCIEVVNWSLRGVENVSWDAPQLVENYAKSDCMIKILKDFNEKHPFPKLIDL